MPGYLNFEAEPFDGFSGSYGESSEEFEAVISDHRSQVGGPTVSVGPVVRDHRTEAGAPVLSARPPVGAVASTSAVWPWRGTQPVVSRGMPGRAYWYPGSLYRKTPHYFGAAGFFPRGRGYGYPFGWRGRTAPGRRWPWLLPGGPRFNSSMQDPQTVAWAQACLAQVVGAWVPQDGMLGPFTRRAIQMLQTQMQLPASGVLDNDTLAALQQACQPDTGADSAGLAPAQGEAADFLHEAGPAGSSRDQAVVAGQMAQGVKDENRLTDAVFYDRHGEWKGKSLKNAGQALRMEWLRIRDAIVRPLLRHPPAAKPPAPPAPPPRPAAPAPVAPPPAKPSTTKSQDLLAENRFDNIRAYRPDQYRAALAAQAAFNKVRSFLPWYQKIMTAVPNVSISLSSHGVGQLVFSMDKRSFTELVLDRELANRAAEAAASAYLGRMQFDKDLIGVLGLGVTLLEIADELKNERMLGGTGPDAAEWRRARALQFVFGLMAEDLSRHDWGNGYFYSRNTRDLVNELAARFAEFQSLYHKLGQFLELESTLARYQGNIPDFVPPEPPVMRSYP